MRHIYNTLAAFSLALAAMPLFSMASQAQETIGAAAIVRNQVVRVDAGRNAPVTPGEAVFRNESVSTGDDSHAKLVFVDETNLAIGPKARVTLDRFVYAGTQTYAKATIGLAVGTFRFTTGNSQKKAYEIDTPVATIGVRGTILDILSLKGRTTVTLVEGEATVCTRGAGRKCGELLHPGDSITVTVSGGVSSVSFSRTGFSFASVCGAAPGLCDRTTLAQAAPGATGELAVLCGR